MTLRQILLALKARIGLFITVLLVTVAAAVAASLLLPRTYKATVSLLVDSKDEQTLGNSQQAFNFNLPQERQSYLQTQIDIMTSRKVAKKVIDDLQLTTKPEVVQAFNKETGGEGSIDDWLAETLIKNLKIETTQSNVLQATFSARSADVAALGANAFAKAYMSTMVELRTAPTREAAAWFDEQLQTLRKNLETAQSKLTDYMQRQNLLIADDKSDIETAKLQALNDQLLRTREQTTQLSAREQQVRRSMAQGDPEQSRLVQDNGVVQRLKADLAAGEAKLSELATQYGPNYPLYQRQLSQNQSLRDRLNAEMNKVVSSVASAARQSRQREADLSSALAAHRQQREADLTKALAAQRTHMLSLRAIRDEANVLKRNVDSAEKAYDIALQRSVTAQVDSRVRQTNVALLSAATAPRLPSSPRLKLNLLLSVIVGTMLGIAVVMLLEMNDRRVRSREDLVLTPEIPLLAVINAWRPPRPAMLAGPGAGARSLPSPA